MRTHRNWWGTALVALMVAWPAWAARPYRGGAVATAHPMASEAALRMLQKGGNATDAAVAAAFTLAVVGPYHSGIGGGGFALVHDTKTGGTQVLDFREVAPKGATRDMYLKDGQVVPGLSTDGATSVAVPGAVAGYLELLEKHGKLPRAVVLQPAIEAARNGFWVTPKYQALATLRRDCLRQDPEASRIFLAKNEQGEPDVPPIGYLVRQPELARTLQTLAKSGAKPFYSGPLAQAMVDTVKASGGTLSLEDLKDYKTRAHEPLEGSYRGYRILTMPPPSAGGLAVVQVLGAMERLRPKGLDYRNPEDLHLYVEAVRRVYVDRVKYLGDPAFVKIPMESLTSPGYIADLAGSIDPKKATPSASLLPPVEGAGGSTLKNPNNSWYDPSSTPEKKNTTHISVIDKDGNAVALTTTVNYAFGSCLVAKGTGILLNDEMDDFAARPGVPNAYGLVTGEANSIAPGKVPLSSMSPTLVFSKDDPKKVMLAVGSPGGSTIPTTVIQVISNMVDSGMDVTRAVGEGRLHHQYLPDELWVDRWGLEPATQAALEAKGHKIRKQEAWGDAEAVYSDPKTNLRYSASDPRNEGAALGQD
ncbi:gamma-glutamyltransferase [Vitiosangium sp. GDMCC 1.1324]|uniref:gamma-glutamyltransferase n=1 Tax=Vitiosangium sp. (strain GDMCC 1.1324) TaxID=2138576 RepID=UPI000D3D9C8E|nr:gamma-glutamyltransferase [Vitiosangium sp. GDMCC 1.1324]PTL83556.1 gamma-glutamyltransferase [Vitiosangium sp. GDMCC 1.1324]